MAVRQGAHAGKGPRGWNQRDDRLIEQVSERLMEDRLLDARNIAVEANSGVVTLSGSVPGASDIAHAEMLARGTAGVTEVRSQLTIRPGERAVDRRRREEEAKTAKGLQGRWGRWLPPFIT